MEMHDSVWVDADVVHRQTNPLGTFPKQWDTFAISYRMQLQDKFIDQLLIE